MSEAYTYRWFQGTTTDPSAELVAETESEADSLTTGFYTVEVTNARTQCSTTETFFVPESTDTPSIIASATPTTVCDPTLGGGSVRVDPSTAGDYQYFWYVGDTISVQPDFTGRVWAGLVAGNYTVVASDLATGTCTTDPITVTVEDFAVFPVVEVTVEEPYSTCDPTRPNGQLYASVNGQTAGYNFIWYDSLNNIISELARAFSLVPGTYRVVVTDQTTGCSTEDSGTIVPGERIVDVPQVEILSHMTDCANPNGSATMSVNGGAEDYIFTFYDAEGNPLPDSLVIINESDLTLTVAPLAAGTYQVTATELITSCVSDVVIFEIADESTPPAFRVETLPARCGESDGQATIIAEENLRITSVEWTMPEATVLTSESAVIKDLAAGTHTVRVDWENGCTSYGSAEVAIDIQVYNAVTPNGDGNHDFFEIDCIELIPDNVVKIFNRAGALVYQASYYDNQGVRFEGTGNRGIYVGGKRLPDGTYFYVIEKNNGSKPKTGYLELVN